MSHAPVMTKEVIEFLSPKDKGIYVDGSFGGGGHTRALLESAPCSVFALDRDPAAVARGQAMVETYPNRLTIVQGAFSDLEHHLAAHDIKQVDGVLFDAGVSSFQLDEPARGFSFNHEGALDMRMDNQQGQTAADLVNDLPLGELVAVIKNLGEEKFAKPIAAAIVAARATAPITTTQALAELIAGVRPRFRKGRKEKLHPATRTFQALRISVNDELGELEAGLAAAQKMLAPEGRLVFITFHSLEDRIVKHYFKQHTPRIGAGVSRFMPPPPPQHPAPSLRLLTKSPTTPSAQEVGENPRARSAKLRAAAKVALQ